MIYSSDVERTADICFFIAYRVTPEMNSRPNDDNLLDHL